LNHFEFLGLALRNLRVGRGERKAGRKEVGNNEVSRQKMG